MFTLDSEFALFADELIEQSGELLRNYFRTKISTEFKEDESPVTAADRGAETLIREMIHRKYPSHGILGEEFGEENADAEFVWVIDPIDGTKSFIGGVPLFTTLLALLHRGEPVLGFISQPVTREKASGNGKETLINGKPARMRRAPSLDKAIFLATDVADIARYQSEAGFQKLLNQVAFFRTWGDAYGYYLLASGYADIMMDPVMSPWDIMSLIPIIRGAGGMITDYQGNDPVQGKSIIAAHPDYHAEVVKILNSI